MRWNPINAVRTLPAFGGFEPTMRVDVYDHYQERIGRGPKKIAEVLSDGARGKLELLDPAFADVLKPIFTEKRVAFTHGAVGADGVARDGEPQLMAPYRRATLEHALTSELPAHNLRGVLVMVGGARSP